MDTPTVHVPIVHIEIESQETFTVTKMTKIAYVIPKQWHLNNAHVISWEFQWAHMIYETSLPDVV